MKILFANPPWEVPDRRAVRGGSRWPHTYTIHPGAAKTYLPYPFFLGYAATYARQQLPAADIFFQDSLLHHETRAHFLATIAAEQFDYLVFETSTPSLDNDRGCIAALAECAPDMRIILVGQNMAYDGAQLLAELPIFAAIKGEYEKGVVDVLRTGVGGLREFSLLSQAEMLAAPPPWREDESLYRYFDVGYFHGDDPVLQLWGSRGCPFQCAFCTWPQSMTLNKVRYYSPEYLRAEITATLQRFPKFRALYFDDDTFNLTDKHVLGLVAVLREFGLPWSAMCRADTLKESTWEAMTAAGCVGVKVGVESGSQRILDTVINKRLKLDAVRRFVPFIRSLGIKVHGTFMYGNPTETEAEMLLTKQFIAEVGFDHIQESGAAPLAGTKLWNLNQVTHQLTETDGKKYVETLQQQYPLGSGTA